MIKQIESRQSVFLDPSKLKPVWDELGNDKLIYLGILLTRLSNYDNS